MLLRVGKIGRPHGLRGEVTIVTESDDPERLSNLTALHVGLDAETVEARRVRSLRIHVTKKGRALIVHFDGTDGREAAAALRGLFVYAEEADLPPLDDDEWYIDDVIGFEVRTVDGDHVGIVHEVLSLSVHDVYVIKREGQEDAMVPAVSAFVEELDGDLRRMTVRPIEGLL